ncbi:hypothetical protein RRG08_059188 [Elysia crispata]|uniref:Uncharacterized protein n=1 Tax=Elysia crispata TaxID=231223 RepID=A0AAE0ZF97_9GAST|nr:hypothetical protein RRG08_059188 [Elysia crispata]
MPHHQSSCCWSFPSRARDSSKVSGYFHCLTELLSPLDELTFLRGPLINSPEGKLTFRFDPTGSDRVPYVMAQRSICRSKTLATASAGDQMLQSREGESSHIAVRTCHDNYYLAITNLLGLVGADELRSPPRPEQHPGVASVTWGSIDVEHMADAMCNLDSYMPPCSAGHAGLAGANALALGQR